MNIRTISIAFYSLTIMLFACNEPKGRKSNRSLLISDCEQVADLKQIGEDQVVVCDLDLMKDTVVIPLSYLADSLHIMKLDDKAGMQAPGLDIIVGDRYLLVAGSYWTGKIPHRLYDKSGNFIANIGGIGRGPGEYMDLCAQQLDEKNNRIYLLPWRSSLILVYDLKGNPLDPIRLPQRIHQGNFHVNQEDNVVSVFVAPIGNDPRQSRIPLTNHFIWAQDMSGKLIHGISPTNFTSIDLSRFDENYPGSFFNAQKHDIHNSTTRPPRQDTLYHYDAPNNRLMPQFTIDFKNRKIPCHVYCELPQHYLVSLYDLIGTMPNQLRAVNFRSFLVEKNTLKGNYIKLENDYLGNMEIKFSDIHFYHGHFVASYEPLQLLELLDDTLAHKTMTAEMREKLTKLKKNIKGTDNNYILYAKLKQ